ncbi:MAG: glycosyltransferase family 2 protein [Bacteroides sp.]|nr:glycosyltransferase family 2 protein [Bacteroides sp.]
MWRWSILFLPWHYPKDIPILPPRKLSILIPARNEEKNIGHLLHDLGSLSYPHIEIIVYDDESTDRTVEIAASYLPSLPELRIIRGTPPPPGWLGKNYACYQLAKEARGGKLLFLDADVQVDKHFPERILACSEQYQTALLSIFPQQLTPDWGSRLVVPVMNWILLSLLPLILVRISPMVSLTAANGQCMLFETRAYRETEPHRVCRDKAVEDMAIMKLFKKKKLRVATLLGTGNIYCHMYRELQEGINGFTKNIVEMLGGIPLLALLFVTAITVAPVWIWFYLSPGLSAIYIALMVLMHIFISIKSRQQTGLNLLLLLPQLIIIWIILLKALAGRKKQKIIWKERNIYS